MFSRWASFHGYGTTDPHAFDDLVTFGDRICSLTQSIPQLRTVYFFPRVLNSLLANNNSFQQ